MFILCQDGDLVLNLDNIELMRVTKDGSNRLLGNCISGENEVLLGEYETREKAIDNMYKIFIDYTNGVKLFTMPAKAN